MTKYNLVYMFCFMGINSYAVATSSIDNMESSTSSSIFGEIFGDTGIALKVGTLGVGLDVSKVLYKDYLNIRFNINSYSYASKIDNNPYNLNLQSYGLLLDYQPFANNFRISSGLYSNNNALNINAGSTLNLNNQTYNSTQYGNLSGGVSYSQFAPYLGIGYGSNAVASKERKGFYLLGDIGVLMSTPTVNLNATCTMSSASGCNTFYNNLATEKQTIQNIINKYGSFYPVLDIGIGYRF